MAQGKVRGRIARAAITAALTGAMALGGVVAPVGVALAEDPTASATLTSATVTMYGQDNNPVANNVSNKYDHAVLVFKAAKIDNAHNEQGGLATGSIQWGGTKVSEALVGMGDDGGFLAKTAAETGAGQSYVEWLAENKYLTGDNASAKTWDDIKGDKGDKGGVSVYRDAKYAADYIGEEIAKANSAGTPYDTKTEKPNVPNITNAGSFADELAKALQAINSTAADVYVGKSATSPNEAFELTQTGYYVLMGTGIRPIWLPFELQDGDVSLYEKNSIPTLEKDAYEGAKALESLVDGDFHKTVDAGNGENVTFRLTATIPAGEYPKMVFTDTLPADPVAGLGTTAPADVVVKRGEAKLTAGTDYTVGAITEVKGDPDNPNKVTGRSFTITMEKDSAENTDKYVVAAGDDEKLTVTYSLPLADKAGMGADGLNVNKARLSYGTGQKYSNESEAKVASYQIVIKKIDSTEGNVLPGAVFNMWDTNGTTEATEALTDPKLDDKALNKDGTLTADNTAVNLTADATDGDGAGTFTVTRADAATYLVHEKTAPAGKDPIDDFLVEVDPEYDQVTGELKALNVEAKGADGEVTSASVAANVEDGKVTITVPNGDQEIRLPVTGMTPSQLGTVVGAVLIAAGAVIIVRRRQQAEQA